MSSQSFVSPIENPQFVSYEAQDNRDKHDDRNYVYLALDSFEQRLAAIDGLLHEQNSHSSEPCNSQVNDQDNKKTRQRKRRNDIKIGRAHV